MNNRERAPAGRILFHNLPVRPEANDIFIFQSPSSLIHVVLLLCVFRQSFKNMFFFYNSGFIYKIIFVKYPRIIHKHICNNPRLTLAKFIFAIIFRQSFLFFIKNNSKV